MHQRHIAGLYMPSRLTVARLRKIPVGATPLRGDRKTGRLQSYTIPKIYYCLHPRQAAEY